MPAARIAASRSELAMVDMRLPDEMTVEFELLGVTDQPGVARVTRVGESEVEITCRIGRFGDPEREDRFLDAFERRLGQLAGVDYAPIR